MKKENIQCLADLLRYYRIHIENKTQEEFAQFCGVSLRTYSDWENKSKSVSPRIVNLREAFKNDKELLALAIELKEQVEDARTEIIKDYEPLLSESINKKSVQKYVHAMNHAYNKKYESIQRLNVYGKRNIISKTYGEKYYYPIDRVGAGNNNTLVVGGPGSGHTLSYAVPNIINNYGKNFIYIGRKQEDIDRIKNILPEYNIIYKDLDNEDITEKDISREFEALIKNKGQKTELIYALINENNPIPFWDDVEKEILYIMFEYVRLCMSGNNQNILSLYRLCAEINNKEDIIQMYLKLDDCDKNKEIEDAYLDIKAASSSIISTSIVHAKKRINRLYTKLIETEENEIKKLLGAEKQCLLIKIAENNIINNYVISIILDYLHVHAKKMLGAKRHVQVIIDELDTQKLYINSLATLINTARTENISYDLSVSSMTVLNNIYSDAAHIIDGCNAMVILKSDENYLQNYQAEIQENQVRVSLDGIKKMDDSEQIVIIKGYEPTILQKPKNG